MIPLSYRQPPGRRPRGSLPDAYQAAVERFARHLEVSNRAANTRRLYLASVHRWLVAGGVPGHIDSLTLLRWLADRRRATSNATVNIELKALRAFYRLQVGWGDCDAGELLKIPRQRKPPDRLPRPLSVDQVDAVLAALPVATYLGLRDYTLIRLAFESGLRASELAGMQVPDLLQDNTLFVRGKGGKHRYVPLLPTLVDVLRTYLAARSRLRPGKRVDFWLKRNGKPLRNGRSVWEVVQRRCWRVLGTGTGIHQVRRSGRAWTGFYPHALRAGFATALLAHGCPITAIAQMMGHSDVATTAHYLGVDLAQLRAAVAKHPRAVRHAATLPLSR